MVSVHPFSLGMSLQSTIFLAIATPPASARSIRASVSRRPPPRLATKASLHYHFPTKADLGLRLIARYHDEFLAALAAIDADGAEPGQKLRQYGQLYAEVLRRQSMCLCGMLAADYATLPKPMRQAVLGFFDANERWLSKVLEEGRAGRSLRFDGPAPERARMILAALEGAMLVARSYGDVGRFSGTAELVFGSLS